MLGPGGVGRRQAEKYCVLLQDPSVMDRSATSIAFVIVSSKNGQGPARLFEVELDQSDGFSRLSIADGRWVQTDLREAFQEQDYMFTLSEGRMEEISDAILLGLQL